MRCTAGMESEEDPWAGMGMDEDEEILRKNKSSKKRYAKNAVSGKTKMNDDRQSMIGPRRESCSGVRLLSAANLGLCK